MKLWNVRKSNSILFLFFYLTSYRCTLVYSNFWKIGLHISIAIAAANGKKIRGSSTEISFENTLSLDKWLERLDLGKTGVNIYSDS